jgi:hypothetical protein
MSAGITPIALQVDSPSLDYLPEILLAAVLAIVALMAAKKRGYPW